MDMASSKSNVNGTKKKNIFLPTLSWKVTKTQNKCFKNV